MVLLGYEVPDTWDIVFFKTAILSDSPHNARVRFTVARSAGGLYLPTNHAPQYTVQASEMASAIPDWPLKGVVAGVAQRVRLPIDDFSGVKTLNAPRYVQAAIEAQQQGWDDAFLLNSEGRICEATSSNVFWWKKGVLHTVPLSEGCVAGVLRGYLMHHCGHRVVEQAVSPEALLQADEIFLTNAIRGIVPVAHFMDMKLECYQTQALWNVIEHLFGGKNADAKTF